MAWFSKHPQDATALKCGYNVLMADLLQNRLQTPRGVNVAHRLRLRVAQLFRDAAPGAI